MRQFFEDFRKKTFLLRSGEPTMRNIITKKSFFKYRGIGTDRFGRKESIAKPMKLPASDLTFQLFNKFDLINLGTLVTSQTKE